MGQIRSAPVAFVTIAGHLGAVGGIPTRVAEELGYLLADRRLLTQAAGALGWSEPQAEAYDERTDAQRGRMSQFLSEFVHLAPSRRSMTSTPTRSNRLRLAPMVTGWRARRCVRPTDASSEC